MDTPRVIGIIGAMDEEIELLKRDIAPVKDFEEGGSVFYSGYTGNIRVILLKCGIGKVNAAIGATLLLSRFRPDYVINTGTAGGLTNRLTVGDTVISTKVIHHDVDATAFGYVPGQVPKMPGDYAADRRLTRAALEAAEHSGLHGITSGIIATGDSFMDDPERIRMLKKTMPAAAAAEMEAAAVAQVCYQFSTPFVVIRSISDIAGEKSAVSFNTFLHTAARNSATLVMEMITLLSKEEPVGKRQ